MSGRKTVTMSQAITGASSGQAYFVTAELNVPGSTFSCVFQVLAGSQTLISYNYGYAAQNGAVNASGILTSAPANLAIAVNCLGRTSTAVDGWATVDNVALSVYSQTAGTNPIQPVARQVVTNNDFSSGSLAPWTTDSTTGRMTFGVVNGRATITYNQIHGTFTSPSWIQQQISPAAEAGQRIRVTADVWINSPNSVTRCDAQISLGSPAVFSVTNSISGYWRVDQTITLSSGSPWVSLFGSCTGQDSTTNIQFDNVYVILNAP